MNRLSLFFLPPVRFAFSSFLCLRHLRPPTPSHPPLCFPASARLVGPSTCSPNFVVCQSHLSSLWYGSIGLLKAADGTRSVPADGGRVEGVDCFFGSKGTPLSWSNPDRVLPSSLDLLSFNVRMSYYWKPLDETLLNELSSLSTERLRDRNIAIIPYLQRLDSMIR